VNNIEVKIQLLKKDAIIPKYAHADDAGMDLYSCEDCKILSGESIVIKTGISVELPINTEAQIRPRSGLALKHQVTVLNSPGTVDAGYRGEIGVILINHGRNVFKITKGMRIAQMIVSSFSKVKFKKHDKLNISQRGSSGFGSTGLCQ